MCRLTVALPAASFALFTLALAWSTPALADDGPYSVVQTFQVGGKGSWDYVAVDSENKLIYLPRTTHTMVLSAADGKVVADIPGQQGNHGVALVRSAGRGFISDGKDASVVVFDLKTNEVLGKIKVEAGADGIIYDPASKKVLVVCANANAVVAISADVDPKSGQADAPIPLGAKPEYLASDAQGKVFINLEDKNEVAVLDTKNMKVVDKWPVAPGGTPVGMSLDRQHRRLFVGCRKPQKLIVMSADDGKMLADLPIGAGCDATKFDNGNILASCRDGSLSVARETSPGKFEIVQNLKTLPGAKTMGVDRATHTIYLPTAEFEKQLGPRGRPVAKPDTFMVLVVRPSSK
jgi:hypothetical protein